MRNYETRVRKAAEKYTTDAQSERQRERVRACNGGEDLKAKNTKHPIAARLHDGGGPMAGGEVGGW